MDFHKPRAARTTTSVVRKLWTALAVAMAAVLLPAAISLAGTGSIGSATVLGAITGANETEEKTEPNATPARRSVVQPTEDVELAVLSETPSVAAVARRDDNGGRRRADDDRRSGRDDVELDDSDRATPADDTRWLDRATRDDADQSQDDSTGDETPQSDGAATAVDATPQADDSGTGADDTPHADDSAPVVTSPKAGPAAPAAAPVEAPAVDASTETATTEPVAHDSTDVPAPDATADASADAVGDVDSRRTFALADGESVTLLVDVPAEDDALTLWTRSDATDCAPHLAVVVDGNLVDRVDLDGTEWEDRRIDHDADAGIHRVRLIAFDVDDECIGGDDEITLVEPVAGEAGTVEPSGDAVVEADASGQAAVEGSEAPATDTTTTTDAAASSDVATSTDATATTDTASTTDTTTTDVRRRFVLRRGESVSLRLDLAADEDAVTLWARTDRTECASIVAMSVDRRSVEPIEVAGTEWQQHAVEDAKRSGRHTVRLAYVGTEDDDSCSSDDDVTDAVTLVEPKAGDEGVDAPEAVEAPAAAPQVDEPEAVEAPADTPQVDDAAGDTTTTTPATTNRKGPSKTTQPTPSVEPTTQIPAPTSTGAAGASVLWQGDFEDALNGFGDAPWNYAGAPTPSTMSLGSSDVGKFDVPSGVGRSELVGTGPAGALSNGQVRYFAWSTYLPADFAFSPKWRILAQWKNAGTGSPPLEMKLINDQWQLDGGWHGGSCAEGSDHRTAWTGTAARGRWTNFVAGIKFQEGNDQNPYAGWVELWQDGKQVLSRTAWKTLYRGCNSYLKLGLYRDPSIGTHDVVYHDNWKMGTTYASVAQ